MLTPPSPDRDKYRVFYSMHEQDPVGRDKEPVSETASPRRTLFAHGCLSQSNSIPRAMQELVGQICSQQRCTGLVGIF